MGDQWGRSGKIAFALVYLTFFLDNVLLTVLVPIIPDWVRGGAARAWAAEARAPLAALMNHTTAYTDRHLSQGVTQAVAGAVLSGKAVSQLVCAGLAAGAAARAGPLPVLRAATAALAAAALLLWWCGCCVGGGWGGWCALAARAVHGAGAAGAAVGGVTLAARALPAGRRDGALAALLGAVALGVLVGYPFGGAAYALWSPGAPFLAVAGALLADLALQCIYLDKEDYSVHAACAGPWRWCAQWGRTARGPAGWCAGAVLLTTAVMAALEPCLPVWISDNFHTEAWQLGLVFVPDSLGYLVCASSLGGAARALGPERLALAGQATVGVAAFLLPYATTLWWVSACQWLVGAGLGAADAALVPALVARYPRRVPDIAALLQSASSVAYVVGPVAGGLVSAGAGLGAALRALAAANLLYLPALYRALADDPLSAQWGAGTPESDSDCESSGRERAPRAPGDYAALH